MLEAQRAGDRTQSVAAMQRVLDKYDYGAPSGVHLPALLRYVHCFPTSNRQGVFSFDLVNNLVLCSDICRCTARMLMQEIESSQPNTEHGIEELCKLFEGGLL